MHNYKTYEGKGRISRVVRNKYNQDLGTRDYAIIGNKIFINV